MTTMTRIYPSVTVYTKDDCRQCDATKRWLTARGVLFTTGDLTDPDNLAAAKSLGHMQAPVVVVSNGKPGDDTHWSGFNPTELTKHFTKESN